MAYKLTSNYFLSLVFWPVACAFLPKQSLSQDIPSPSGKFRIGHHRFEWTDSSRTEVLSTDNSMREIVADVWYPAENSGNAAVLYLDTLAIHRAFGNKGLQSILGAQAAALVRSTGVHTHAIEDAPFTRTLGSAPVVFFSHGMGMITQAYTTQIEELASHGYIVVALSHPYDAWLVSFSNGKQITFETKQRKAAGNTEDQHVAYENKRVDWWAGDILFALYQLFLINKLRPSGIPFAKYMDLTKVGAMGHSAGGRAAARACQLDTRIKSCADQDGVAMMQPFYPDAGGTGMKQPFLLFERDRNKTLTSEDAASMNMKLEELMALVNDLRSKKKAALASTGGSFHVLIHFDSSSHMSFSDLPLLQAKNNIEAATAGRVLQVVCRYTREFFDKTLRGIKSPLYDGRVKLNYIDLVQPYKKKGNKN